MQRKWTDEQLIEAVKEGDSYSDVTRRLGISMGSGGAIANVKSGIARLKLDTNHWYDDSEYRTETTKRCSICKEFKLYDEFFKATKSKDGYSNLCKPCKREHHRLNNWEKKHGMTVEAYEVLMQQQDHKCAICGQDPNGGRWDRLYVDHDHTSGKPRGLLCCSCNLALGMFKDDQSRLINAVEYLRRW